MLYPLSYEGASAQLTCQPVPTADREYQRVPTAAASRTGDWPSTHGAHRAAVNRRGPNGCQLVPSSANQCQRLTERFRSTPQDPHLALRPTPRAPRTALLADASCPRIHCRATRPPSCHGHPPTCPPCWRTTSGIGRRGGPHPQRGVEGRPPAGALELRGWCPSRPPSTQAEPSRPALRCVGRRQMAGSSKTVPVDDR
jgi:hypothetical protein